MMRNNKILIWLVVLLLILNIATISTIFYHNYKERSTADDNIVLHTDGQIMNGRYFRQTLGFDDTQIDKFREANHHFRPAAREIIYGIGSLKNEMFNELEKSTADTVKLNIISKQIGSLHGKLKQETFQFYLQLKSICKAEQLPKLEAVFAPLFRSDDIHLGRGRGNGGACFSDSVPVK